MLQSTGPIAIQELCNNLKDLLNDPDYKLLNRTKFSAIIDKVAVVMSDSRIMLKQQYARNGDGVYRDLCIIACWLIVSHVLRKP